MGEHGTLECLELGARLEAELVDQQTTGSLVGTQRVGLAAPAVESEDQLSVEPLVKRVVGDQVAQGGDRLSVVSRVQPGVGETLVRGEHQFIQAASGSSGEPEVIQVGERRTAQESERGTEVRGSQRLIAGLRSTPAIADEPLETCRVDVVGLGHQHVPGVAAHHLVPTQQPSQLRDLGLQRVGRVRRLLVAPELVDQAVRRHRMRDGEGEQPHQGLELGPGNRLDNFVVAASLDAPQQSDHNPTHEQP